MDLFNEWMFGGVGLFLLIFPFLFVLAVIGWIWGMIEEKFKLGVVARRTRTHQVRVSPLPANLFNPVGNFGLVPSE